MNRNGLNSFGNTFRAYRLGYGISEKHQAFIRLQVFDDFINVQIAPLYSKVPDARGRKSDRLHIVWWEKGGEILDLIPALKGIKNPKVFISFDIDKETGERILK